jgi:hypothetical protein
MNKNDEIVDKIMAEKPIKPTIENFDLTETELQNLKTFTEKCRQKEKLLLLIIFIFFTCFSAVYIFITAGGWGYIILTTIASSIISWGILPSVAKLINGKSLQQIIFNVYKSLSITANYDKNSAFEKAMADYKQKNNIFERAIGRMTNNYWLSLNPKAFEDAVAELFADNGWDVYATPATRDKGVDLFLEKDGIKAIVQCKTYKKVLGPNAARDLYGTMVANEASLAFLAAPGGFSKGTKEFCNGKPITLLDIDGLSKMFYPFEDYTPHWIDTAKSLEDIRRGLNKHVPDWNGYRKRRY